MSPAATIDEAFLSLGTATSLEKEWKSSGDISIRNAALHHYVKACDLLDQGAALIPPKSSKERILLVQKIAYYKSRIRSLQKQKAPKSFSPSAPPLINPLTIGERSEPLIQESLKPATTKQKPKEIGKKMAFAAVCIALISTVICTVVFKPFQSVRLRPSNDQRYLLNLVNSERKYKGVKPLSMKRDINNKAQLWAKHMAESNEFEHSELEEGVTTNNWQALGENIGYASSVKENHINLMNSEGHRENILYTQFNYIGIGVYRRKDERVYVCEVFMYAPD